MVALKIGIEKIATCNYTVITASGFQLLVTPPVATQGDNALRWPDKLHDKHEAGAGYDAFRALLSEQGQGEDLPYCVSKVSYSSK